MDKIIAKLNKIGYKIDFSPFAPQIQNIKISPARRSKSIKHSGIYAHELDRY